MSATLQALSYFAPASSYSVSYFSFRPPWCLAILPLVRVILVFEFNTNLCDPCEGTGFSENFVQPASASRCVVFRFKHACLAGAGEPSEF